MLISNLRSDFKISCQTPVSAAKINFGQSQDKLSLTQPHFLPESQSISAEEKRFVLQKIDEINAGKLPPMNEGGKFGVVYAGFGYPSQSGDIVIKAQKNTSGEFCDDFAKEAQNLKNIPDNVTSTPRFIARVKSGDRHYLVETMVKGQDVDSRPMTPKDIKGLLCDFSEMDKVGMYHDDLWNPNLLIADDGIKIVDFGSVKPSSLKQRPKYFPPFYLPSNAFDFEKRKLCWQLGEFNTPQDKKKLRQYLALKSDYHKSRAEFLPKGSAREFERLQAKFLRKPSRLVLEIEASKIRMAFYNKQAEVGFPALENNYKSIKESCLLSKRVSKALKITTDKDYKKYLEYQKKFADFWTTNIFKELVKLAKI